MHHSCETRTQKRGVRQVYISSRSAKDCAATEKELNALGPGQCVALPADMQKLEEVERLVKELSAKEKALHVLVNNAGAAWGDTIDDYPVRLLRSSEHGHRGQDQGAEGCEDAERVLTGLGMDEAPHPQPPTRVYAHPEVPPTLACRR